MEPLAPQVQVMYPDICRCVENTGRMMDRVTTVVVAVAAAVMTMTVSLMMMTTTEVQVPFIKLYHIEHTHQIMDMEVPTTWM